MSNSNDLDSCTASDTQQTTTEVATEKPAIPAFRPFSAETYAPKKADGDQWHNRNNKSNHDKRPHTPPRGTRRSMGKR